MYLDQFVGVTSDTVFNQVQIPVLLEELHALRVREPDAELAVILNEVAAVVERAVDQIHTYVRFVGD